MRIGLVCPYDLSRPGGVQEQVLGLSSALQAAGDTALVIGPGLPDGVDGVDLGRSITLPANRSKVPISADPTVLRIMRSVSSSIDLLHVHEPLMPAVSLLALRVGKPVVATFHAAPGPLGSRLYALMRFGLGRALGPNVRQLTAVSATARAPLPAGMDVAIIPNAIDFSSFEHQAERLPAQVAFLGRDEPRKGLDLLIEAWPSVIERLPEADLVVMGSERDVPGIKWMGRVDTKTKVEVLNQSSVYVAPHTGGESFGIVLLEAMAAGAAVVASDLDAFTDVAGHAARYFDTGSAPSLADAVVSLLESKEIREGLSQAGRIHARLFDWDRVSAAYRDLYQRSLS